MASPLPTHCYAIHPTTGEAILVRRDVPGYWPCLLRPEHVQQFNETVHNPPIAPAVAAAMLTGSMFGWGCPGAKPESYPDVVEAVVTAYGDHEKTPDA
jgi:hypothetical protein